MSHISGFRNYIVDKEFNPTLISEETEAKYAGFKRQKLNSVYSLHSHGSDYVVVKQDGPNRRNFPLGPMCDTLTDLALYKPPFSDIFNGGRIDETQKSKNAVVKEVGLAPLRRHPHVFEVAYTYEEFIGLHWYIMFMDGSIAKYKTLMDRDLVEIFALVEGELTDEKVEAFKVAIRKKYCVHVKPTAVE